MSTTVAIILVVLVVIAAIGAWAYMQKRRTMNLRSRFGPEYERAVGEHGGKTSAAEKALEQRALRTEHYHIRPLNPEERDRFAAEWKQTQARFVDDPSLSIREADRLVCEAMRVRGYPVAEFDRRAEDLSVDHPGVVRNYRAAHAIAISEEKGGATTEDLRKALVHYRELFDELLESTRRDMPELSQRRR